MSAFLYGSGSATAKEEEGAGRLPKDADKETEAKTKQRDPKPEMVYPFRPVSGLASDTDSVDSEDLVKSTEADAVSDISTYSKPEDVKDSCLLATQLSTDSYILGRQDTGRSMEWYGTSMDMDVGNFSHSTAAEAGQLMSRINESHLELKAADLENEVSGGSRTPADDYEGSRSSPDLSGRGMASPLFLYSYW